MAFFVYIIKSEIDGSYYIGSRQNLVEKLKRHNQGRSKFTKSKRPWKRVYSEAHTDKSAAVKKESGIKNRKRKNYIESLIGSTSPKSPGGPHPPSRCGEYYLEKHGLSS